MQFPEGLENTPFRRLKPKLVISLVCPVSCLSLAETAIWADSGQLQFWSEPSERSIFQTFWKPDFGARFLFIELDTSNFGYLLIFYFL